MSNALKRLNNQIARKNGTKLRCRRCGNKAEILLKDGYGYICGNCGKVIKNLGETKVFDADEEVKK